MYFLRFIYECSKPEISFSYEFDPVLTIINNFRGNFSNLDLPDKRKPANQMAGFVIRRVEISSEMGNR